MNTEEIAKKRVEQKKKFFKRLREHITGILILLAINWMFTPGFWWSLIPIVFMLIDLFDQYLKTYGYPGRDPLWEQKAYEKELRRLKRLKGEDIGKNELDLEDLPQRQKEKQKSWDERDLV